MDKGRQLDVECRLTEARDYFQRIGRNDPKFDMANLVRGLTKLTDAISFAFVDEDVAQSMRIKRQ